MYIIVLVICVIFSFSFHLRDPFRNVCRGWADRSRSPISLITNLRWERRGSRFSNPTFCEKTAILLSDKQSMSASFVGIMSEIEQLFRNDTRTLRSVNSSSQKQSLAKVNNNHATFPRQRDAIPKHLSNCENVNLTELPPPRAIIKELELAFSRTR